MRFGFALPQVGSAVGPETLVTVAKRAEDLGVDSLWVLDRILWPDRPKGSTIGIWQVAGSKRIL